MDKYHLPPPLQVDWIEHSHSNIWNRLKIYTPIYLSLHIAHLKNQSGAYVYIKKLACFYYYGSGRIAYQRGHKIILNPATNEQEYKNTRR